MKSKLSKERRSELIDAIKAYLLENHAEDVGDLKSGLLLDFVLEKLGPPIYNQAIRDAQVYFQQKVDDLDGECFESDDGG